MSPRFLRYRFPSEHASEHAGAPVESARALAQRFLAIPTHDLDVGALDGIACNWAFLNDDPGSLDMVKGEAMGEELGPWLRLVVGPGGRRAWLDVDVEEMGRIQAVAFRNYKRELRNQ